MQLEKENSEILIKNDTVRHARDHKIRVSTYRKGI